MTSSPFRLVKDPIGSFEVMDKTYEEMSDGHKISSIFLSRANTPKSLEDDPEGKWKLLQIKGRAVYEPLFHQITKEIHEHIKSFGTRSKS